MVIELRVVQFWSEIILVIYIHSYDFRPNSTVLSLITIINQCSNYILESKCGCVVVFCSVLHSIQSCF